jgi:hypothetical protein
MSAGTRGWRASKGDGPILAGHPSRPAQERGRLRMTESLVQT